MKIWHFNPENDLSLANGDANFVAPASARKLAEDLSLLPKWYAAKEDFIIADSDATIVCDDLDRIIPWGWSLQEAVKLRKKGVPEKFLPSLHCLERIRSLSHRRTATKILSSLALSERYDFTIPDLPEELYTQQEVFSLLEISRDQLLKMPWSSSGKGLCWCNLFSDGDIMRWLKAPLRKMGSVMAETIYAKAVDFAMGFEVAEDGRVRFAGYSLFETDERGAYRGNVLLSNARIREYLASYVAEEQLEILENELSHILERLISSAYVGYLGVDMMIYKTENGYAIHPCVEMNLRMTMGMVARLFFDNHLDEGAKGIFRIDHNIKPNALLYLHEEYLCKWPIKEIGKRIKSGYISLTPVNGMTHYSAYALLE
ncbi:MAG: hypothetical protein RR202_12265 [Bacteroidales bacterium]